MIRLVLNNHSAHISKETRSYLETTPQRFVFAFTPTHGSWLNLIENQFSKMTRTMLRGIHVASKQEPIDRVHRYFEEINADPVAFRWKYKMDETLKTWRRYCLGHNRLLTRAAPYGADSEPRTSESGCAITYDVLFRLQKLRVCGRRQSLAAVYAESVIL